MDRRTRKQRGGLWEDLAKRAASAYVNKVALPVTKYAVNQAVKRSGLANDPRYQAAQAMARDARAAYQSPTGQAFRGQMASMAQRAIMPQMAANPYGRSAGPVAAPVPVAQPVPVAAPVAAAPPSGPLSLAEQAIVNTFLRAHAQGKPSENDASYVADIAKRVNNKDRNNALLAGIGALATDVKALHDAGTPQTVPFETALSRTRGYPSLNAFELYEKTLADPASRSRIAQELVSAQDPPNQPNSRRFLAGIINQYAAAVRNAMQKRLLLGGKTRRGRKARRMTRRR